MTFTKYNNSIHSNICIFRNIIHERFVVVVTGGETCPDVVLVGLGSCRVGVLVGDKTNPPPSDPPPCKRIRP